MQAAHILCQLLCHASGQSQPHPLEPHLTSSQSAPATYSISVFVLNFAAILFAQGNSLCLCLHLFFVNLTLANGIFALCLCMQHCRASTSPFILHPLHFPFSLGIAIARSCFILKPIGFYCLAENQLRLSGHMEMPLVLWLIEFYCRKSGNFAVYIIYIGVCI